MQREVYVVAAVRTAIGSFGGSLKDVPLADLATSVIRAAIARSGAPADSIGHVVVGNVIPTEPRDAYLSRLAAMNAGVPKETPAFNVNRLCGSGLQAIICAAQCILLGDAELTIGAGAESMSRGPYVSASQRWGARLGNAEVLEDRKSVVSPRTCSSLSNTATPFLVFISMAWIWLLKRPSWIA